MGTAKLALVRILAVLVVSFGLIYITWRWTSTLSWPAWWIAIPLAAAETYSLGESVLYALTMWNARRRPAPPPALPGRTVDVFITTYNEPLELVLGTALAARDMTYPHMTWILDDGSRPDFAAAASEIGVGYITRGPEWEGRQRFAKAGNVNNALSQTTGEFVAILDADQVPEPRFLDRVLGYFDSAEVAFVQTPQRFWNVPDSDPLGCQAELFYGPIQQGKDGWEAAFFCGSNAVLRREALMALGLTRYTRAAAERTWAALRSGRSRLEDLLSELCVRQPSAVEAVEAALDAIAAAERQVRRGDVLAELTFELRDAFRRVSAGHLSEDVVPELDAVMESVDVARTDLALAIHPLDTTTITEDMATAMHLHAMGWSSAYHHEVLVHGLAPDDIQTMLSQRQRWAAGTMQVFFKDNPLLVRGLTAAQRLMYLATMSSYLNGFAVVAYIAAPMVFLLTGVYPLLASPITFFCLFLPFFASCQLLFQLAGKGSGGLWRGQQFSFALFPTWIAATLSGAAAGLLGKQLTFSVTAKTRQARGRGFRHVRLQLGAMALLVVSACIGVVRAMQDETLHYPTLITLAWVALDLALLGSVIGAARYKGPSEDLSSPLADQPELKEILRRRDTPAAAPVSR
jgi:cellulose synthase (UDP-forming)